MHVHKQGTDCAVLTGWYWVQLFQGMGSTWGCWCAQHPPSTLWRHPCTQVLTYKMAWVKWICMENSWKNSLWCQFFFKFIFRETGKEGEGEGEKHWCARDISISCLLHTPYWVPGLKPRHAPDWVGIDWWSLGSQASTQSTEPQHPGWCWLILKNETKVRNNNNNNKNLYFYRALRLNVLPSTLDFPWRRQNCAGRKRKSDRKRKTRSRPIRTGLVYVFGTMGEGWLHQYVLSEQRASDLRNLKVDAFLTHFLKLNSTWIKLFREQGENVHECTRRKYCLLSSAKAF